MNRKSVFMSAPISLMSVAIPFLVAFMAPAPASASGEKLLRGAKAAICGPELKGLSVKGHGFNVKKATVGISPWDGTTAVVAGQISHRLNNAPDDQIYYTINYKDGKPDKQTTRIDRGGIASIFNVVADAIKIVNAPKFFGDDESTGIELKPENLPKIATGVSTLIKGSGWEEQAGAIIAMTSIAATRSVDFCPEGGGGGGDRPPRHEN